ncbi:MAG TPA: tetratricopeptide repeat protein [Gemmatimonadaceae bacterium]|nr:tetratricopeptide repeat protein [Gemmatimonadaceae bacterium]
MKLRFIPLGAAALVAAAAWWVLARPARLAAAEASRNAESARRELEIRSKDIEFYIKRAKEDPQGAEDQAMAAGLYLQRARETGDVNDYRAAERYADESLALRKVRNGKAQLTYASALLAQHKFPQALAAARTLVDGDPDQPRYRALYAELLVEMGRYDAARVQFDSLRNDMRMLAVAPRYARYLEFVGRTDLARWVLRRAVNDTRDAELPREQIAWFHLRAADLEIRSGRLRSAERELSAALRLAPEDGRLWSAKARMHALEGNWRAVLHDIERVGDRKDIATTVLAGDAFAALGDTSQAQSQWRKAEAMALANPEPFNRQLTLFHLEHGIDVNATRTLLEREITIRQDVYGWDQLAFARYLTGDVSGAAQAIKAAMAAGTKDANLYYRAALIARAQSDTVRSRTLAAHALELNPHFHHRYAANARVLASP